MSTTKKHKGEVIHQVEKAIAMKNRYDVLLAVNGQDMSGKDIDNHELQNQPRNLSKETEIDLARREFIQCILFSKI